MFVELDIPLAHERREEMVRQVGSRRLERELRAGRRDRHERRWTSRLVRGFWAAPEAQASRA
jgi:hypothetical protein